MQLLVTITVATCCRVDAVVIGRVQEYYALCYRAALEYLGSFDHYAN